MNRDWFWHKPYSMYGTNSIKQNFNIQTFCDNKMISNKLIIVFSLKLSKKKFNNRKISTINLPKTQIYKCNTDEKSFFRKKHLLLTMIVMIFRMQKRIPYLTHEIQTILIS